MRFRRRDHESYIGGYDPEHEMPDPDRHPRDRWESEAYRHNARDSRYGYRWNPDRYESRDRDEWMRRRAMERDIQPRDRYENRYGGYGMVGRYDQPWDRGYDRGWDRDRDRAYDRGYDRSFDPGRSYDEYAREREYLSRGYPRPYQWESRWDREKWERDYENEYWGRPNDPSLRWDRDRGRRY